MLATNVPWPRPSPGELGCRALNGPLVVPGGCSERDRDRQRGDQHEDGTAAASTPEGVRALAAASPKCICAGIVATTPEGVRPTLARIGLIHVCLSPVSPHAVRVRP